MGRTSIAPALVGGALTVTGTIVGAFLTYILNSRSRKEQRAYDSILRRREWELGQHDKAMSNVSREEAGAIGVWSVKVESSCLLEIPSLLASRAVH